MFKCVLLLYATGTVLFDIADKPVAKKTVEKCDCTEAPFLVPNCYSPNCESDHCIWFDIAFPVDYYNLSLYNRWGEKVMNCSGQCPERADSAISVEFEDLFDVTRPYMPAGTYIYVLTLKPSNSAEVKYCHILAVIR
jgi:hypothetical protein